MLDLAPPPGRLAASEKVKQAIMNQPKMSEAELTLQAQTMLGRMTAADMVRRNEIKEQIKRTSMT